MEKKVPIIAIDTTIVNGVKISAKKEKINIEIRKPKWDVNSNPLKILPKIFLSLSLCMSAFIPINTGDINNPRNKARKIAYKVCG